MREAPRNLGLPWEVVVIRGIDQTTGMAEVENSIGKVRRIPMVIQRSKGALPVVGERWVIDRTIGQWTFTAVLEPTARVVGGDRSDGTALTNLLIALEEMGLISDETTA